MDYSLLIGVHDLDRAQNEEKNESDENLSQEDDADTDDDQLNSNLIYFLVFRLEATNIELKLTFLFSF